MKWRIFTMPAFACRVGSLVLVIGLQPAIARSPSSSSAQTASPRVAALKIRNLVIGQGAPKTIVSTTGNTSEEVLRQASRIADSPDTYVIEYRIDYLDFALDADKVATLGKQVTAILGGKPMILTFRTKAEVQKRSVMMPMGRCTQP